MGIVPSLVGCISLGQWVSGIKLGGGVEEKAEGIFYIPGGGVPRELEIRWEEEVQEDCRNAMNDLERQR